MKTTIKEAKKQSWREYCSKIVRATPVGEVWGIIKSMRGIKKEWQYPLLKVGEELAITDEGKAEIMRGRERTKGKCPGIIEREFR